MVSMLPGHLRMPSYDKKCLKETSKKVIKRFDQRKKLKERSKKIIKGFEQRKRMKESMIRVPES